jgi:hypothetical protein
MKLVIGIALAVVVLSGCQPQPVVEEKPVVVETPTVSKVTVVDLSVEPNHRKLDLTWRKLGQGLIAGYNIYISERPLAALFPGDSIDPTIASFNTTPFPGDTIPEDGIEHFEADNLDNGVRYYVSVRAVYPDRSLSAPSNEVISSCGARGDFELAQRHSGGLDGYSFEKNEYVACDDKACDLYFYSKEGRDYLASPSRLDAFIHRTNFMVLPWRGVYSEVAARLGEAKMTPTADQVEVTLGDWVLLKCTGGAYALVNVREFKGTGLQRQAVLSFAYNSLVGETAF